MKPASFLEVVACPLFGHEGFLLDAGVRATIRHYPLLNVRSIEKLRALFTIGLQ